MIEEMSVGALEHNRLSYSVALKKDYEELKILKKRVKNVENTIFRITDEIEKRKRVRK